MKPIDRELINEWIEICIADCSCSASDFDMGMMKAFQMMQAKIESGALDVEEESIDRVSPPMKLIGEITGNVTYCGKLPVRERDDSHE